MFYMFYIGCYWFYISCYRFYIGFYRFDIRFYWIHISFYMFYTGLYTFYIGFYRFYVGFYKLYIGFNRFCIGFDRCYIGFNGLISDSGFGVYYNFSAEEYSAGKWCTCGLNLEFNSFGWNWKTEWRDMSNGNCQSPIYPENEPITPQKLIVMTPMK